MQLAIKREKGDASQTEESSPTKHVETKFLPSLDNSQDEFIDNFLNPGYNKKKSYNIEDNMDRLSFSD